MPVKVSKYFDDAFHSAEGYNGSQKQTCELEFKGHKQLWNWNGSLDRNNNRILSNVRDFASDTYLAVNHELKIVGGYSFILESGYEGKSLKLAAEE